MPSRVTGKASVIATHLNEDVALPIGQSKAVSEKFQKYQNYRLAHKGRELNLIELISVALKNKPIPSNELKAKAFIGGAILNLFGRTGLLSMRPGESADEVFEDADAAVELINAVVENILTQSTHLV